MLALGLNSGSSFDGIDAVLVDIAGSGRPVEAHAFHRRENRRLAEARGRPGAGGLREQALDL